MKCQICDREFRDLCAHLRMHSITVCDYKTIFPEAVIRDDNVTERRSQSNTDAWAAKKIEKKATRKKIADIEKVDKRMVEAFYKTFLLT